MTIELLYDRDGIKLDIPNGVRADVIRKPRMPLTRNPDEAIATALASPVGSAPLSELASQAKSACILICDITRPVPNKLFLRPLIETIHQADVAFEAITILIATGLHRANLGDELRELIGDPWVLDHVQVINHDAECDDDHIDLGYTPGRGVPIRLDRRFVNADLKIATGLVEPHFMAGYSGGRKVIAPGVAHQSTIRTFHNAEFMANPAARNCNLEGNPLHEEQLAIVDRLGGALALNTIIDEERNLAFVNFGEIKASHLEAVAFIRRFAEVPLQRRYDLIVTSSAGYPLDKTYYQTVKGMVGAIDALSEGGELIIVSACSEGLGSSHYKAAQDRLLARGTDGFMEDIKRQSKAEIDEWQTQMQLKAMAAGRVTLVTQGLKDDRAKTGIHVQNDLNLALRGALARRANNRIAVIPEGPYVIPMSR